MTDVNETWYKASGTKLLVGFWPFPQKGHIYSLLYLSGKKTCAEDFSETLETQEKSLVLSLSWRHWSAVACDYGGPWPF